MTFWQVVVMTIISEAVAFAIFKDATPSVMFKKWATMAVYLVMSQGFEERGKEAAISQAFFSYALSVIFLFLYSKVILRSSFAPLEKAEESLGSLGELGMELIANYLVPFEILSVILVAAMVGAVVLSKRSAE